MNMFCFPSKILANFAWATIFKIKMTTLMLLFQQDILVYLVNDFLATPPEWPQNFQI